LAFFFSVTGSISDGINNSSYRSDFWRNLLSAGAWHLRILSYTTLFPNRAQPHHGVFVRNRLRALARLCSLTLIAPVNIIRYPEVLFRVPCSESLDSIRVFHPWFGVIPGLLKNLDGYLLHLATYPQIRAAVRPANIDLVDVHYAYPDGKAGQLLAQKLGKPYVVTVRGSDLNLLASFPRRRRIIQDVLQRANAVIAVSQSLKEKALELGVDPARLHVIANGIDRDLFFPRDRKASRRRLGLPPDTPVVLFVGRLDPVKGLDLLVHAIQILKDSPGAAPRCYLVGSGPEQSALSRKIGELRLENHVILAGPVAPSQLPDWYSASDLFCLLSLQEGCPNVILESLACGVPVVATNVGGIPELIEDGLNGYLVSERQADIVAQTIQAGISRSWDRVQIASSNGTHDWAAVAQEQTKLFSQVLEQA
jgi:teichuronic acid biosynthesis glycosyltransferase TuaC